MSDTYLGWDGKPYPWPPPDGWYYASDGRWWAPGTGPNPPPTSTFSSYPEAGAAEPAVGTQAPVGTQTAQYPSPGPMTGGPVGPAGPPPGFGYPQDAVAAPRYGAPGPSAFWQAPFPDSFQAPPGGQPPDFGPSGFGPGHIPRAAPPKSGGGPGKIIAIVVSLAAVAALGVVAVVLAARANDETAATTNTSASTGTTDAATQTTSASPSVTGETTSPDSVDDSSTVTETTTAPIDPPSTLAPQDLVKVAEFRALLLQNDLTSDALSDAKVVEFGSDFCIFAGLSEDPDDFAVYREQAIKQSKSELSAKSLSVVIDAAVVVFCPEDATRLGVTV